MSLLSKLSGAEVSTHVESQTITGTVCQPKIERNPQTGKVQFTCVIDAEGWATTAAYTLTTFVNESATYEDDEADGLVRFLELIIAQVDEDVFNSIKTVDDLTNLQGQTLTVYETQYGVSFNPNAGGDFYKVNKFTPEEVGDVGKTTINWAKDMEDSNMIVINIHNDKGEQRDITLKYAVWLDDEHSAKDRAKYIKQQRRLLKAIDHPQLVNDFSDLEGASITYAVKEFKPAGSTESYIWCDFTKINLDVDYIKAKRGASGTVYDAPKAEANKDLLDMI